MKKIAFLTALLMSAPGAHACFKIGNAEMGITGSYQSGKQSYTGKKSEYVINNCRKTAGQYLVVTSAPVFTDLTMRGITSIEGELPQDNCSIENSPFSVSRPSEIGIHDHYKRQSAFLSRCLELEISDARGEIDAAVQLNCEITPIDKNKVLARGPQCVFGIAADSNFTIRYRMNAQCVDRNQIKLWGDINPMDVKTQIGLYETADLTPGNPDYNILGFIDARVTLQPDSDLLPVSGYFGRDTANWPTQFGAEIDLGKVTMLKRGKPTSPSYFLRVPYLVNNNCPEVCKEGLCSSPCDFYAPVAAKFTLSKKGAKDSRFKAIDWWYQGNVVPGKFLGELSLGKEVKGDVPQVNDLYQITAEFSNPSLSYRVLVEQAKQAMIRLISGEMPFFGTGTGELDPLGGILATLLPPEALPEMGDLGVGTVDTQTVIDNLNAMIGVEETWPPYYTQVISEDRTDNANKVFSVVQMSFRVSAIAPSGAIGMDQIVVKRTSKVYGNSERKVTNAPQIKCAK